MMLFVNRLKRLRLCAAGLLTLLICVQSCLIGCSDKKSQTPEDKPDEIPVVDVVGSVDRTEIGGDGLTVHSIWGSDSTVTETGNFTVTVSDSGSQILLITDSEQSIRGCAISVPGYTSASGDSIHAGAESTALSLLLMTPGIAESRPSQTATRLQELRGLSSFPQLVSLLKSRLVESSLDEITSDSTVFAAYFDCASEWFAQERLGAAKRSGSGQGISSQIFDASVTDSQNQASVRVSLRNKAMRYVNVYRRTILTDGNSTTTPVFRGSESAMAGPSFDDYFYHGVRTAQKDDFADFRCNVDQIQYWVAGVGFQPATIPGPYADIDPEFDKYLLEADFRSVFEYMVKPLVSLMTGITFSFLVPNSKESRWLASAVQDVILQEAWARYCAALNTGDSRQISEALQSVAWEYLTAVVAAAALSGFLGIAAPIWGLLGFAITYWGILCAWGTITAALTYWSFSPRVTTITLANPFSSSCEDITPPAAVSDLDTTAVLPDRIGLSWTVTGDDGQVGQATSCTVCYSTQPISESEWSSLTSCVELTDLPSSGGAMFYQLTGLMSETSYYIAMKVGDEVPNWSDLSNILQVTTPAGLPSVWAFEFVNLTQRTVGGSCATSNQCPVTYCPDQNLFAFLPMPPNARSVIFLDIPITFSGQAFTHHSSGWGGDQQLGTFVIRDATVSIEGEFDQELFDFDFTFSGSASIASIPIFDRPGPFEMSFSVENAQLQDSIIVGKAHYSGTIDTPEGNCMEYSFEETSAYIDVTIYLGSISPFKLSTDSRRAGLDDIGRSAVSGRRKAGNDTTASLSD